MNYWRESKEQWGSRGMLLKVYPSGCCCLQPLYIVYLLFIYLLPEIALIYFKRVDAFELWCRKRLLRVPWTARRSDPSILKEISPEYSLEGLIVRLKLQNFGHLIWRTDSLEKTLTLERLKAGGEGDNRGQDGWMASPTQWKWVEQAPGDGEGEGSRACCSPWGCQGSNTTEQLNNNNFEVLPPHQSMCSSRSY